MFVSYRDITTHVWRRADCFPPPRPARLSGAPRSRSRRGCRGWTSEEHLSRRGMHQRRCVIGRSYTTGFKRVIEKPGSSAATRLFPPQAKSGRSSHFQPTRLSSSPTHLSLTFPHTRFLLRPASFPYHPRAHSLHALYDAILRQRRRFHLCPRGRRFRSKLFPRRAREVSLLESGPKHQHRHARYRAMCSRCDGRQPSSAPSLLLGPRSAFLMNHTVSTCKQRNRCR